MIDRQIAWTEGQGYPTDSGPVFRRPKVKYGDRRRGTDNRVKDWRPEWKQAMKVAKERLPTFGEDRPGFRAGLHFHGFRGSVVTQLLAEGVQPKLIARLTGHRTTVMIDRYNSPDRVQFREAMARRKETKGAL